MRILWETRTLSFTFIKLINIILRPISTLKPKPLLLYLGIEYKPPNLAFYLNDILGAYTL